MTDGVKSHQSIKKRTTETQDMMSHNKLQLQHAQFLLIHQISFQNFPVKLIFLLIVKAKVSLPQRLAVKASSQKSLLYMLIHSKRGMCQPAVCLAHTLIFVSFSLSVLERLVHRACAASKAVISFSTSVSFREQMKWTSAQQSSWSTDGVSFPESKKFTFEQKYGRRTG